MMAFDNGATMRGIWLVVIVCYLDDSGEDSEPIQTLAGLVSTSDAWQSFELEARGLFNNFGVATLHTVDLHHRREIFDEWTPQRRTEFSHALFRIVEPNVAFGIECSVLKRNFKEGIKSLGLRKEGSPIGMCFRIILDRIVKDENYIAVEKEFGANLSFVVESGHKNNLDILHRFDEIKAMDPGRFGSLTFRDKHEFIALQAADFIAFYTRRIRAATPERPRTKDKEFFLATIQDLDFRPFLATEFGI